MQPQVQLVFIIFFNKFDLWLIRWESMLKHQNWTFCYSHHEVLLNYNSYLLICILKCFWCLFWSSIFIEDIFSSYWHGSAFDLIFPWSILFLNFVVYMRCFFYLILKVLLIILKFFVALDVVEIHVSIWKFVHLQYDVLKKTWKKKKHVRKQHISESFLSL